MSAKKETTPEKKLIDDLWEEIKLVLVNRNEKIELNTILEQAYKNGASCAEIQRIYEENLPKYQRKTDEEIEDLREVLNTPLSPEDKKKILFWVAVFAAIIIVSIIATKIFGPDHGWSKFDEAIIGGVTFQVPQPFELYDSGETPNYYYRNYKYIEDGDDSRTVYYLDFYVFKDKNAEQALSYFEFDDGWEINRDVTIGEYTGIRVDVIVLPFRNKVHQWFIFNKDGKAVAIFLDHQGLFKTKMETIIN